MPCEVKFDKSLPTECILSATSDVIAGRMSVSVAKKIMWCAGSVMSLFEGDDVPEMAPDAIFIAMDGLEPTLENVAAKLNASAQTIPNTFQSQLNPAAALNPATIALLIQFAQMALEWYRSRKK